eukprot:sb/3477976/
MWHNQVWSVAVPARTAIILVLEKSEQQKTYRDQEPIETSKQPIRAHYLGHVTSYPAIRDQYFLIRSEPIERSKQPIRAHYLGHVTSYPSTSCFGRFLVLETSEQ